MWPDSLCFDILPTVECVQKIGLSVMATVAYCTRKRSLQAERTIAIVPTMAASIKRSSENFRLQFHNVRDQFRQVI